MSEVPPTPPPGEDSNPPVPPSQNGPEAPPPQYGAGVPPPSYGNLPPPGYGGTQPPPQEGAGSTYYRPPQPWRTPTGAKVDFDAISVAWFYLKNDIGNFALASFVFMVIIYALSIPVSFAANFIVLGSLTMSPQSMNTMNGFDLSRFAALEGISMGLSVITQGLFWVLLVGMMDVFYRKQMGLATTFNDFFGGFRRFGPVFVTGMIQQLLAVVGILLLVIPGFYIYGALAFAPYMAYKQELAPVDAIRHSYETLKGGNAWMMFLLLFCAAICSALGACACGIGIIFTFPILYGTIAASYYNFFPPMQQPTGEAYAHI